LFYLVYIGFSVPLCDTLYEQFLFDKQLPDRSVAASQIMIRRRLPAHIYPDIPENDTVEVDFEPESSEMEIGDELP
jgi:hypothetical protein